MMETGSNYYSAWAIYLLAVLAAELLLWCLVKRIKSKDIRWVLHLCLLALLITPVALDSAQQYWVPAVMAALMDGLNIGWDAAMPRLIPILLVMLVLLILSLVVKLVKGAVAKSGKRTR
ncbi:MAG: hypothetical protein WCY88_05230 [Spongiibacteraceae bacterium]